jgi:diphthamide biosynthesis protein 4
MPPGRFDFDASINYYEVLDVPYTATKAEITRSYRRLMRFAHPDRAASAGERDKAEERAKLLNAAYAVLSRTELRREYDQLIRQRAVNDLLFQRYTGNAPGRGGTPPRRTPSPATSRAQRRATHAAFAQLLLYAGVFVVVIVAALLLAGLGGTLVHDLLH